MKYGLLPTALPALLLLLLGLWLGSCLGSPSPAYVERTDTLYVPMAAIEDREPALKPSVKDRVLYRTLPPETVRIATGDPAPEVGLFCAAAVAAALGDTTARLEPVAMIRSGSYQPGWFFGRGRFVTTAPLSTGGAIQPIYAPRGAFTFRVVEDGVELRESRWGWIRPAVEALTWGGLGFGACKVADALR